MVIQIISLILFGCVVFFLTAALIIYLKSFTRKEKPQVAPIPDSFEGEEVEMKGMNKDMASHVHDPIIMGPLLEAKRQWAHKNIELITVIGKKGTILRGDFYPAEYIIQNEPISTNEEIGVSIPKKVHKIAILVHGMQDSSSGMAYLAEEYHNLGYSVLCVNLRGHGISEGKFFGLGYLDAKDILCWIEELNRRNKNNEVSYILHGVSMGGAAVVNSISLLNFFKKQINNLGCLCC